MPVEVEVIVPDEMNAGVYANGFGTWFNQTDFTLDGFVHLPGEQRTDEAGNPLLHQPVQVVARMKFPPALIFRLIQQLNDAMTDYEAMFGEIQPLGEPPAPPADNSPPPVT